MLVSRLGVKTKSEPRYSSGSWRRGTPSPPPGSGTAAGRPPPVRPDADSPARRRRRLRRADRLAARNAADCARHRQRHDLALAVLVQRRLAALHGAQHPAVMILPGLEPNHVVARLIEEHREALAVARDHADQHQRRPLRFGRRRGRRRRRRHRDRTRDRSRGRAPRRQEQRAVARRGERRERDRPERVAARVRRRPLGRLLRGRGALGAISTGAGRTLLGGRSSAFGEFAPRASTAPSSSAAAIAMRRARLIGALPLPGHREQQAHAAVRLRLRRSAAIARRTAR